jgi:hypothetical protein
VPFWLGVPELAAKWNKPTAGARLWFHFDWLALAMQSVENGGLGWQRCHSANAARLATERPSLRLQSIRQHPEQYKKTNITSHDGCLNLRHSKKTNTNNFVHNLVPNVCSASWPSDL